jgi:hypothetical protein
MRIRSGNVVRVVERRTSEGKVTLLDGDFLDTVDILIIVSFDSQRTGQHANESELTAIREFLDDPGHTLFVPHFEMLGDTPHKLDVLVEQSIDLEAPPHPFVKRGRKTFDALLQSKPNVFGGRLLICDATIWTSTNGGLGNLRQFWANITRLG